MTTFDAVAVGRELALRSRRNQGLPDHVEDNQAVARIAAILMTAPNPLVEVETSKAAS